MVTLGRLSEEILRMLLGGNTPASKSVTQNEIKISIGQMANALLKTDYVKVNMKSGETIPNGIVMALYEDIAVASDNGVSKSVLPIKPMQLPRNIGVYSIYPKYTNTGNYVMKDEFIPIEMGQSSLMVSQPLINDLLGQIGYECYGNEIIYNKDIKQIHPEIKVAMRLAVMDVSLYDDYDPLPVLPEHEILIKQEVYKMYAGMPIPDKLVDSTTKEQKNVPITQQKQS